MVRRRSAVRFRIGARAAVCSARQSKRLIIAVSPVQIRPPLPVRPGGLPRRGPTTVQKTQKGAPWQRPTSARRSRWPAKHRNYITRKNRRNDPDQLGLKKYCPHDRCAPCTARRAGALLEPCCEGADTRRRARRLGVLRRAPVRRRTISCSASTAARRSRSASWWPHHSRLHGVVDLPTGLVKQIKPPIHATVDLVFALALVAAPFFFGFRTREGGALALFVVVGVAHLLITIGTRFPIGRPRSRPLARALGRDAGTAAGVLSTVTQIGNAAGAGRPRHDPSPRWECDSLVDARLDEGK